MKGDSRVKKSLLNVRINLICYFATLIVSFFTRKVLLDNLGVEFIGLSSTIQGVLGFLNLAELGVGGAIAYVLYKPIADANQYKIKEIVSVLGFLYNCIGYFILFAGIVLSLFIPLIFSDTPFSWSVLYFGFYCYLTSSVIGYVVNYKSILLAADQRNYIVTGYYQISTVLKVICQMALAIYTHSFYVYFAVELLFAIFNSFILNWKINQSYPWLKTELKEGRKLLKKYPEITRYIKQIIWHQVGSFVQTQTSPVLIYSFVNLTVVALYSNYTLVTHRIQGLIKGILDSTAAGVGSLIASSTKENIYATFRELLAIRFIVGGFLSCCLFFLINPFISVWLGSQYVMDDVVVFLIVLSFFICIVRDVLSQFASGFGLFYDVWAPIVESIIFIVVAVVGGHYFGIKGVLCASSISIFAICYIWRAYFVYSKGFDRSVWHFWGLFAAHTMCLYASYFFSKLITEQFVICEIDNVTWKSWITAAIIYSVVNAVSIFTLNYITSFGTRRFVHRFIKKKNVTNEN